MFTGLIEETGKILKADKESNSLYLTVQCDKVLDGLKIGDSVAINGACQTVIQILPNGFKVFASCETLSVTTFNDLKAGDIVNLERTLRLCDRLDGHMVSGHIDGVATVQNIEKDGQTTIFTFECNNNLAFQIIKKGSVAINGVSLTVADIINNSFKIAVIPHSLTNTNLKYLKINDRVNLETDIISKYVEKYLSPDHNKNTLDIDFLKENGFF